MQVYSSNSSFPGGGRPATVIELQLSVITKDYYVNEQLLNATLRSELVNNLCPRSENEEIRHLMGTQRAIVDPLLFLVYINHKIHLASLVGIPL